MKIIILGSQGMAGHMVYDYLKTNTTHQIFSASRKKSSNKSHIEFNASDFSFLEKRLLEIHPDVIVNLVGVLVKDSSNNLKNAIEINSLFPLRLNKFCELNNIYLIHLSTDCVFDGKAGSYNLSSTKNALDNYGMTKNLGEFISTKNLVIRTSIIGPEIKAEGVGLFHWFMQENNQLTGYKNAYWSGVTTLFLAKFIVYLIKHRLSGLIHLTNNDKISKYDLLVIFNRLWKKNKNEIISDFKYKIDKSLISYNSKIYDQVPDYVTMFNNLRDYMSIDSKKRYQKYNEFS
tara:strand:+ start:586 stop:1452 length:867 start_codon:yes stop_codon:yes gene_type:complete